MCGPVFLVPTRRLQQLVGWQAQLAVADCVAEDVDLLEQCVVDPLPSTISRPRVHLIERREDPDRSLDQLGTRTEVGCRFRQSLPELLSFALDLEQLRPDLLLGCQSLNRKVDEVGLLSVEPIELRLELLPQHPVSEFLVPERLVKQ